MTLMGREENFELPPDSSHSAAQVDVHQDERVLMRECALDRQAAVTNHVELDTGLPKQAHEQALIVQAVFGDEHSTGEVRHLDGGDLECRALKVVEIGFAGEHLHRPRLDADRNRQRKAAAAAGFARNPDLAVTRPVIGITCGGVDFFGGERRA
jgi:hypothetical protein